MGCILFGIFRGVGISVLSILFCRMASAAGESPKVYHEPETGDFGSIVIFKASSDFSDTVSIYDSRGAHGRSMTNLDLTKRRDFNVEHRATILLEIDLSKKQLYGPWVRALKCHKVYEVPFSIGDLGLLLEATDDTCKFTIFRSDVADKWIALNGLHEWKGPLRTE